MIPIKRLFLVCLTFTFFLSFLTTTAQKVNRFDENKQRTGVWRKYYSNKRIRYVGTFKKGKETGVFKFYSITSSRFPEAIKTFHTDSDSVTVKYLYEKGQIKGKGMLFGRKKVGKWNYYFKNGKIFSEENYVEGKLSGDVILNYRSNGKVAESSQYKDGLLHGVVKRYSETGVLIEEVLFENGKENGLAKYFELDGKLKEIGTYKDGSRIGKWDFFIGGEEVDEKTKRASKKANIKN